MNCEIQRREQKQKLKQKDGQSRKHKWADQQEQYLKLLRETRKLKSWQNIAKEMNAKFPESQKSSKQCREKYINYARFYEGTNPPNVNNPWTVDDDLLLEKLYSQFGSSWSNFTYIVKNKSQNCIKNRFYNRLKKLSKKLDDHRAQHKQQVRGACCYDSMIRILDFSNQVKNLSESHEITLNTKSNLFTAREEILKCCFHQVEDQSKQIICERYCSLLQKIKDINIKIRCFGICKAKNRKNWKLTNRGLVSILQFDQNIDAAVLKELLEKQSPDQEQIQSQDIAAVEQKKVTLASTLNEDKEEQAMQSQAKTRKQQYPMLPYILIHPYHYFVGPSEMMIPSAFSHFTIPSTSMPMCEIKALECQPTGTELPTLTQNKDQNDNKSKNKHEHQLQGFRLLRAPSSSSSSTLK